MGVDEAIIKFKLYCQGKGDFDELDLKKVVVRLESEAYERGYADKAMRCEKEIIDFDIQARIDELKKLREYLAKRTHELQEEQNYDGL